MVAGSACAIEASRSAPSSPVPLPNVRNPFFFPIVVALRVQVGSRRHQPMIHLQRHSLSLVLTDSQMLPEPIPSSQVCYASQYVTGEELEFDKCTKCLCLHNVAFCSVSLCPPLRCSSPIYDSSLCCPVCPPRSEPTPSTDLANMDHVCLLDNGLAKHAGELWKQNDCQSCLCSREGNGQIECFSQMCDQQLPCSHPVLKKGQCCPFCLPPTAAVAVCIFNYVQYRSGEHWNVRSSLMRADSLTRSLSS